MMLLRLYIEKAMISINLIKKLKYKKIHMLFMLTEI